MNEEVYTKDEARHLKVGIYTAMILALISGIYVVNKDSMAHKESGKYYTVDEKSHFQELTGDKWFLKAHFNTFLAYYNPDINKEYYKNTNSLVNFYRKFANEVFGTDFQQLPDKKYYIYYDQSPILFNKIKGEYLK